MLDPVEALNRPQINYFGYYQCNCPDPNCTLTHLMMKVKHELPSEHDGQPLLFIVEQIETVVMVTAEWKEGSHGAGGTTPD